jgi:hypothetical protein
VRTLTILDVLVHMIYVGHRQNKIEKDTRLQ